MSGSVFRLIFSNSGSVDSDNISKSLNDWEILEFVSVHNELSEFSLGIVRWVNNLKNAHEQFLVSLGLDELIWESSINDNTVEVDFIGGGEFNFADFSIVILG